MTEKKRDLDREHSRVPTLLTAVVVVAIAVFWYLVPRERIRDLRSY